MNKTYRVTSRDTTFQGIAFDMKFTNGQATATLDIKTVKELERQNYIVEQLPEPAPTESTEPTEETPKEKPSTKRASNAAKKGS